MRRSKRLREKRRRLNSHEPPETQRPPVPEESDEGDAMNSSASSSAALREEQDRAFERSMEVDRGKAAFSSFQRSVEETMVGPTMESVHACLTLFREKVSALCDEEQVLDGRNMLRPLAETIFSQWRITRDRAVAKLVVEVLRPSSVSEDQRRAVQKFMDMVMDPPPGARDYNYRHRVSLAARECGGVLGMEVGSMADEKKKEWVAAAAAAAAQASARPRTSFTRNPPGRVLEE
jgi:hypothetical protein